MDGEKKMNHHPYITLNDGTEITYSEIKEKEDPIGLDYDEHEIVEEMIERFTKRLSRIDKRKDDYQTNQREIHLPGLFR